MQNGIIRVVISQVNEDENLPVLIPGNLYSRALSVENIKTDRKLKHFFIIPNLKLLITQPMFY